MTCSLARVVVLAGVVGVAVSSLTGRDVWGLVAAGAAGLALLVVERVGARRHGGGSCALPSPPHDAGVGGGLRR